MEVYANKNLTKLLIFGFKKIAGNGYLRNHFLYEDDLYVNVMAINIFIYLIMEFILLQT